VTWKEIEQKIEIDDFDLRNMPARIAKIGDLWKPLLAAKGRFRLESVLHVA
jgi:bifunctional non-homologous end joining protein LigD